MARAVISAIGRDRPGIVNELSQAVLERHLNIEDSRRTVLGGALAVVTMDHPGVVAGIAGFFSQRQINIRDLNTETERAPHTGTQIFNLRMTVEVPVEVKINELRGEFEAFCSDQDLDGSLEAA